MLSCIYSRISHINYCRSDMGVMQPVGAQGPLAASRPSYTELLMKIMKSLLASSSAGLPVFTIVYILCSKLRIYYT